MDLYAKLFAFAFVAYLSTIAVHFLNFSLEQERSLQSQANPWHQHELDADTPDHALLKHSHARWDLNELLSSGGDLGGSAMWAAPGSPQSHNEHQERTHEVAEEEVTELDRHVHDPADALHAKLTCTAHDSQGSVVPSDESEQGLVYWHAASSNADDQWVSPWKRADGPPQYVVFESDNGGWNNVRMALEAVFVFARATGRTVVLPADDNFYFPEPGVAPKDFFQHTNGYDDFFPLDEMRKRLGPDSVITMAEFLEREAYPGHLARTPPPAAAHHGKKAAADSSSGQATSAEAPHTQADGQPVLRGRPLRDYLRGLAELDSGDANPDYFMPRFKEGGRLGCLAIPATPDDPVMQASVNPKLEQKAKSPNGAGGALPENKSNAQKKKQQQQPDATKKGKEKQAEANTSSSSGRRLLGGTDGSVDPAVAARLEAFAAGREVMAFEGPWRHAKVIHFAAWPNKGFRMLMHFYTLIFFADEELDRRMKRFVRDHLRYHDTIWCAAHRVVELVKRDSRANHAARAAAGTPVGAVGSGSLSSSFSSSSSSSEGIGGAVSLRGNSGGSGSSGSTSGGGGVIPSPGSFSTFHVRHGEFQFKVVRLGAEEILANTLDLLAPGELVYVATDEHDKDSFFGPLRAAYEVKFLDDYFEEANLKSLPKNMLGLVDTLVAAQGRVFVGTWFSTFSGYIIRLRGYFGRHADSFYYFAKKKFAMQDPAPPSDPFYTREWPTAWENIDD